MPLLALDTSTGACSVALLDETGGQIISSRFKLMPRGHAEALAPMVSDVMRDAGCKMTALARLGVTTGPGTFTGVRIGIAFARALAAALAIPLSGISTLRAIAANVDGNLRVAAVMDARRGEMYMQIFKPGGEAQTEPQALGLSEAAEILPHEKMVLVGSGAELVFAKGGDPAPAWELPDISPFPDARNVASLLFENPGYGLKPAPLYLRPPDAKQPQKPAILKTASP